MNTKIKAQQWYLQDLRDRGTKVMGLLLIAHTAFTKEPRSDPSTHASWNSSSRRSDTFPGNSFMSTCPHSDTNIPIIKNNKSKNLTKIA